MSAFSLPMPPARLAPDLHGLTERSATIQMSEDRCQMSGRPHRLACKAMQHPGNLLVVVPPSLPRRLVDIAEIEAVARPQPHRVGGADRHDDEPSELRLRACLAHPSTRFAQTDLLARRI